MATLLLDCPIVGLNDQFPDHLFLLHHPESGKYGCFNHQETHGLASFSDETAAFRFAEWIEVSGMVTIEVSFDEAREVAKARPLPVTSLMLLDNLYSPVIHFVR